MGSKPRVSITDDLEEDFKMREYMFEEKDVDKYMSALSSSNGFKGYGP